MRINIKTKGTIIDRDIKALYLIQEAMNVSNPRMRVANLNFVLDKYDLVVRTREEEQAFIRQVQEGLLVNRHSLWNS